MSGAAETVNAIAKAGDVVPFGLRSLPDPEQLEMLRDPVTGKVSRAAIATVRGRGRPKGAKNVRSKKIADLYVQRFGDPLMAIGELANTPLRQLIEVLMEADGSAEREDRLLDLVDQTSKFISAALKAGPIDGEQVNALQEMAEKVAEAARTTSGKAGKLALDALALQLQAKFKATEYVHGKQPIAIDMRKTADVVVVAPELLKEHDIDPVELANQIAERGIEALSDLRIADGEFEPVESGDE